ncbi:TlyA family RNA methyltransferase [Kocuria aegyptia]|uniref:TlyA family rRNA (Cytidine-2'-O)-methyltransferase n=1 Tax=Kocuria aegyptia TaxID=330943 RepID=A0ABN2KCE0_9MICC
MSSRLDQELTARALARSRTVAARWIGEGRVLVNGRPATKPSVRVGPGDVLEVRPVDVPDYVSRAGHKLAGALAAFPEIDVAGRRCLDAGASTGGFTDVLLRQGAREVVAVDVGHEQLDPSLRADPRVRVFEGMNVRWMRPKDIGGPAELTVCDLSFISLTLVLEPLAAATVPGGDLVLMVKPQFEVGADRLARTGVVTSEQERARAVDAVAGAARTHGLAVRGRQRSPLPGQDGNHEFFLWCRRDPPS